MRNLRRIAGLLLAGLLPACGGSNTPTPLPTPTPCSQTPVLQVNGAVPRRGLGRVAFPVTSSGRLDITVDWTFATTPIGVYVVTAGSCPIETFNAGTCTFLVRSETTAKPRKASANASAGNYELLVANFSDQDESVSGQVVLSSSTCPAFAAGGNAPSLSAVRPLLTEAIVR
jgi:hypothetical protein